MASYTKRGKTWQYTISHKPKPIRKGGFKTKKEAQIVATEVEANLRKGISPLQRSNEPFADYFKEWVSVYKTNINKNTRARYHETNDSIRNHFGSTAIQDITKRSYQGFLNEYAKTHAKETTRKLNTHIRACVRDAIDEGVIRIDFTRSVVFSGRNPAKRPEEKHLSYFESKRLAKELYQNGTSLMHYLLLLALTSGMRFGELVGLTRKDFNFDTLEISINKVWGYTKKMDEGFGDTKNKQTRIIKMDKKTMDHFKDLFERTPENIHGLVFYSPSSKYKVLSNGGANKELKSILDKLKIEHITPHGLRHTHASVLLYKGVSLYYVSERLGHSDYDTTLSHYAHIVKELREKDENSTTKLFEEMIV